MHISWHTSLHLLHCNTDFPGHVILQQWPQNEVPNDFISEKVWGTFACFVEGQPVPENHSLDCKASTNFLQHRLAFFFEKSDDGDFPNSAFPLEDGFQFASLV
jgi:hypothetical protein